jgi:hypothetical protein
MIYRNTLFKKPALIAWAENALYLSSNEQTIEKGAFQQAPHHTITSRLTLERPLAEIQVVE